MVHMHIKAFAKLGILILLLLAPFPCIAVTVTGAIFTHDPSRIVKCGGKYYVYFTGRDCPMISSSDLIHWEAGPPVLSGIPAWARAAVPGNTEDWIWAPDVIFVNGKYYLFYAFSTFGSQVSVIGLVTSPTLDPTSPDYHWTDEGMVVSSDTKSDFNAIDPCPVLDKHGDLWLSFGSWFGQGIVLVKLDKSTGKPVSGYTSLAAGQSTGPEASFITYHGGYYYLFENEGLCCRGVNSTYKIMMGRSQEIAGPYLDKSGKRLAAGGGTLFLGTEGERIGPGCIGILSEHGIDRFSFHYYDGNVNGRPTLGLETLVWGADGWPIPGDDLAAGRYEIVAKGSKIALGVSRQGTLIGLVRDQTSKVDIWNVQRAGDGYYTISSIDSGEYLGQRGSDGIIRIVRSDSPDKDDQLWRIEQLSDGAYRILSKGDEDAISAGSRHGKPVLIAPWTGQGEQEWLFSSR